MTLDVTASRIILRVREVLTFGVLMLEGHNVVVWKDHAHNCVPCHLPNVDGRVNPSLAVIRASLRCMLCGSRGGVTHMLVCDKCSKGWHMACMTPPMDVVPAIWWFCLRCTL
jgi:cbb3-type cytochrome oxidase cytochrome c subunit